jgi:hypothetical protein
VVSPAGAAFLVDSDLAKLKEAGVVQAEDAHLPFFYAEVDPVLFGPCSANAPPLTHARTAYHRIPPTPTNSQIAHKRFASLSALTAREGWKPFTNCLRDRSQGRPVQFGDMEAIRIDVVDPGTCQPEGLLTVIEDGPVLYIGDQKLLEERWLRVTAQPNTPVLAQNA